MGKVRIVENKVKAGPQSSPIILSTTPRSRFISARIRRSIVKALEVFVRKKTP
jgi:hypothetical protein